MTGRVFTALALLGLAISPLGAQASDFDALVKAVNDDYRHALLVTSQGNAGESVKRMESAIAGQQTLLAEFFTAPPKALSADPRWQDDLARVSGYLAAARELVKAGRLGDAHDALEPVRVIWMELRERNGIPTFGDKLTAFHHVMEFFVLAAGPSAEKLTDAKVEEMRARVGELTGVWGKVVAFEPKGLSAEQAAALAAKVAEESAAIEALVEAVAAGDKGAIVKTAPAIKKGFAPIFIQFG